MLPYIYDCIIIGRRAESLRQFLSKGRKVAIEGKLRYSSWEKDGHLRSKVEIAIDDLELLDSGRKRTDQVEAPALYDQEIPF